MKMIMRRKPPGFFLCLAAFFGVMLSVQGAQAAFVIEHSHSQGIGYADLSIDGGNSTSEHYLGRFIMEPIDPLPSNYPTYQINTIHGLETGFYSYCLEPNQSIGVGHGPAYQYNFTINPLGTAGISVGEASLIKELFGRYNPLLSGDPAGPYTGGTFRTAAAALYLAILKIDLDATTETLGSWDFGSGLMRVNSNNITLETGASAKADAVALAMLNSLTGDGPMAIGLEALRNDTNQDLLIQAVPVPGAVWLLGSGLVGLVGLRKKFSR